MRIRREDREIGEETWIRCKYYLTINTKHIKHSLILKNKNWRAERIQKIGQFFFYHSVRSPFKIRLNRHVFDRYGGARVRGTRMGVRRVWLTNRAGAVPHTTDAMRLRVPGLERSRVRLCVRRPRGTLPPLSRGKWTVEWIHFLSISFSSLFLSFFFSFSLRQWGWYSGSGLANNDNALDNSEILFRFSYTKNTDLDLLCDR